MNKRDLILIGIIVAVIAAVCLTVFLTKEDGACVIVRIDGKQVATYSLLEDGEYSLNGGTNILRIQDGKAFLVDGDCPDKNCVNQGKIDQTGESITCLPNRLTVTVYGAQDSEVDLVS
jgi:hypothetical protein